jgi:predicted CoA-substrate-specific enzyme activase
MRRDAAIVAGVDVGAATAKAVVLGAEGLISSSVLPTGASASKAAEEVTMLALESAGLSMDALKYVVSTGYGRRAVSFSHKTVTEIMCHARGASSLVAAARTVIDIGGQDSKVIALDGRGGVINFAMNDKCAAGTGRFLEVMAGVLHVEIGEIGQASLRAKERCRVTSTCTVFAESEMVSLRAEGRALEDILAGIHHAMAHRVVVMGRSVGFNAAVVFTGGVARNIGMRKALEGLIGLEIVVPEEPQIVGALGAAILAREELMGAEVTVGPGMSHEGTTWVRRNGP